MGLAGNGRNLYPLRSFPFDDEGPRLATPDVRPYRPNSSALFPITPVALGRMEGSLSSAKPGAVDPGVGMLPGRGPNRQTRRRPLPLLPFWPFWELVEQIFPCERRQPAFSRHAGVCAGDPSGVKSDNGMMPGGTPGLVIPSQRARWRQIATYDDRKTHVGFFDEHHNFRSAPFCGEDGCVTPGFG